MPMGCKNAAAPGGATSRHHWRQRFVPVLALVAALFVAGVVGVPTSFTLDGSGPNPVLRNTDPTWGSTLTAFTVEAWIRLPANLPANTYQVFAAKNRGPGGTGINAGVVGGTDGLTYLLCGAITSTGNSALRGAQAVTPGQWTHLACAYSGTTWALYKNGAADTTASTGLGAPLLSTALAWVVGSEDTVTGRDFAGDIDNVRLWNAALSSSLIAARYATRLAGSETNLISYITARETLPGSGVMEFVDPKATATAKFALPAGTSLPMLLSPNACPGTGCGSPFDNINECATNNGGCNYRPCSNSVGSFSCGACPAHYTGAACDTPDPTYFCSLPVTMTGLSSVAVLTATGYDWPGFDAAVATTAPAFNSPSACRSYCQNAVPGVLYAVVIPNTVCACKLTPYIVSTVNSAVSGFAISQAIANVPPNTPVRVTCPSGYTTTPGTLACASSGGQLTGTVGQCTDINECATNNGGCGTGVQCVNGAGTFTCLPVTAAKAAQFAPIVQFAPWEALWPTSIDTLLNSPNTHLKCHSNPSLDITNPTQAQLAQYNSQNDVEDCYIDIDPTLLAGMAPQSNRVPAPMYWTQQVYPGFVEINYAMLYGRNGAQTIRLSSSLYSFNALLYNYALHDGDLEHISVRISSDLNTLLSVGVWAHGNVKYYPASTFGLSEGRPLVRVSLGGHGTYAQIAGDWLAIDSIFAGSVSTPLGDLGVDIDAVEIFSASGGVSPVVWRPFESPSSLVQVGLDNAGVPVPPPSGGSTQYWSSFAGRLGKSETVSFMYCRDVSGGYLNGDSSSTLQSFCNAAGTASASSVPPDLKASHGPTGLASNPWAKGAIGGSVAGLQDWQSIASYTGWNTNNGARPSVLYTGSNTWRIYFQDSGGNGLMSIQSTDGGATWGSLYHPDATFSSGPKAFYAGGSVHVIGRDGNGNGLLHFVSSDGGVNFVGANPFYLGINCGSSAEAIGFPDGRFAAVCTDNGGTGIMVAHVSATGALSTTYTGFTTNGGEQPHITYFNGAWHIWYADGGGNGLMHLTTTASVPTSGWAAAPLWHPDATLSSGPGGVVYGGRVHLFFRDGAGNGMLHWRTDAGSGSGDSFDPLSMYTGVNCAHDADAACDATVSMCMAVCTDNGGNGIMLSRLPGYLLAPTWP